MEQQHFDAAAALGTGAEDACGNDSRFVQHKHVAAAKALRDFVENSVFDPVFLEHHQPARIAFCRRMLRDQFLGKLEIVRRRKV